MGAEDEACNQAEVDDKVWSWILIRMFGEKSTEDQADYAKDAMELLIEVKEVKNENKHFAKMDEVILITFTRCLKATRERSRWTCNSLRAEVIELY